MAYVHIVEPRYDQASTEGAFSGEIERSVGSGGDCISCTVSKELERAEDERFSLWNFRDILKTTPLIGAGGYYSKNAREAIEEGTATIL